LQDRPPGAAAEHDTAHTADNHKSDAGSLPRRARSGRWCHDLHFSLLVLPAAEPHRGDDEFLAPPPPWIVLRLSSAPLGSRCWLVIDHPRLVLHFSRPCRVSDDRSSLTATWEAFLPGLPGATQ